MLIQRLGKICRLPLTLAGAVMVVSYQDANAQQWEFQPRISLSAEYDDNPRLREGNQAADEIEGGSLDASGRLVRRGPASVIQIDPRIRTTRYPNNGSEESDDLFLNIYARRNTASSNYGISVRASREAVLTAELADPTFDDPDIPDPVSDDSGLITAANDRDRVVVTPFANFEISERTDIGFRASHISTDYENDVNGNVDYETTSLSSDIGFKTGERSRLGLTVFTRQYETDNFFSESDVVGALLVLNRDFSRTLRGSIAVGSSETDRKSLDQNGQRQSTSDSSAIYRANLTKSGEVSRIVADVQQSVDPSGSGGLRKRLQFRFRFVRALSPLLTGTLEARWQNLENVIQTESPIDRDFARLKIALERRLSRTWSLRGSYTWTQQDFSDNPGDATSNAFSLGVTYEPRRRP